MSGVLSLWPGFQRTGCSISLSAGYLRCMARQLAGSEKTEQIPALAPGVDRKHGEKIKQWCRLLRWVIHFLSSHRSFPSSNSFPLSLSLGRAIQPSTSSGAPCLHLPTILLLWSPLKMKIFLLSYIVLKLTAFISHTKNLLHTWKLASLSPTVPLALRKGTVSFKSIMTPPPPPLFPTFANPMQRAVTCSCLYIP